MKNFVLNLKSYIFFCIVALFSFGIVSMHQEFSRLALLIYFIWLYVYKESFNIKNIIYNKKICNTIKVLLLYIIMYIITNLVSGSVSGIYEAFHYLERFLTAGSFIFIIYGRKNIALPILLGFLCSVPMVVYPQFLKFLYNLKNVDIMHHNCFAGWVVVIIPYIYILSIKVGCSKYSNIIRLVSYIAVFFCMVTLFISPSRGGIIATLVMLILASYLIKDNRTRKYIFALLCMFFVFWLFVYFNHKYDYVRGGDFERILFWRSSWQMFLDYPLFGIGYGNWSNLYMMKYCFAQFAEYYPPMCHNVILYVLSETGILGLGVFGFVIYNCIKCCYCDLKTRKELGYSFSMLIALVGTLVHNMVDVIIFYKWFMFLIIFLWIITVNDICNYEMKNKLCS